LSQSELTEALETQIEVLERTGETAKKTGEQTKTFAEEINEAIRQQGDSLANNLARSLAQGKFALNDFKSFFNKILEDIATMIIQKRITQPLVDSILGSLGGTSGGGGIGSFISGLGMSGTGGGFSFGNMFSSIGSFLGLANGGIARGGRPYMVGERGPEMFMPNTTGRVISTENMSPGGESIVNFNINAVDTQTGVEFLLKNKPQIIGMVSQAHNHRGRQGITG
jgi:phage-related minor tail protein